MSRSPPLLSSDQRDRADIADPTERTDPTEKADRVDPTDATDRADPTDPTLSTEPADPIDRIDPRLAIDRNESSDRNERSPTPAIVARRRRGPFSPVAEPGRSGLLRPQAAGHALGKAGPIPRGPRDRSG
jgi:hypothetical protein